MHGFINLDKPLGMSSAFAVDRVKKQLRAIKKDFKIGHAGTLDPLASGVLVLAVGEATKLVNYAQDAPKAYSFTATWGEERNTDDGEGVAVATSDKRPSLADIEAILPEFTGDIQQVPPAFSAIKKDGVRAYASARAGENVDLAARGVRVDKLAVSRWQLADDAPPSPIPNSHLLSATTFEVDCSKGTYIRSLARDIGRKLGVYGYVSMLRRVSVGKFHENQAISLEKLEEFVHKGDLGFIMPPQTVLDDILAHSLGEAEATLISRGGFIEKPASIANGEIIACYRDGVLVAMARAEEGMLRPERVFNLN